MVNDWKDDARFAGAFIRGGSWEVGLRIARRVQVGKGNGRPSKTGKNLPVSDRVSLRDFASEAGVTHPTVAAYLKAWELAADRGLVDHAVDLAPDDEYDWESAGLDDANWKSFYRDANPSPAPKPAPTPGPAPVGSRKSIVPVDDDPEDDAEYVEDEPEDDEEYAVEEYFEEVDEEGSQPARPLNPVAVPRNEEIPSDPTSELIMLGQQVVAAVDRAAKLLHSFYDHPEYQVRGVMDLDVDTSLHHFATVAHKPDLQDSYAAPKLVAVK
jgi:hypothetical protein